MTLGELKEKNVINTRDGGSLGRAMDLEFCEGTGQITALVVPGAFNLLDFLRGERAGIVIPWANICKIGDDVILVDVET